ncbi:hypothetical protein GE061_002882 [Apolygus lucorum]|uniref:C-type lectin domain-containing protein n=1 Tax=Apolygus lucorum TaxID=248454 RepID=A0A6A4JRF0_APOLU|nr:hypothetical protein GE061_002882 [Apolygus lucorum]
MKDEVASNEDSCQERKNIVETLNELKESRDKVMVTLVEMEKRWVSIQRDVIGLVKGEVASLTDQVQKLMIENIMLKAVNQKWKDQVNELLKQDLKVDDMKRIVEENKNLTQQLASERNQHKDLKSKLEAELFQLRTERQEFLETLNSTKVELNAAKSNLANAEYLSKEATNRANVLQQDLTSKTTLLQNLKSQMDEMMRIAEENRDLTQQLGSERNQLKDMKSKLEAELLQLRTERQGILAKYDSSMKELNTAKSKLANAEFLSKAATNRANVLQQDLDSKMTLLQKLKSKMDDMKPFAEENEHLTQQLALERNQHKDMKSKLEAELRQLRTERQGILAKYDFSMKELKAAKSNLANAEHLSKEATDRAKDLASQATFLQNLKNKVKQYVRPRYVFGSDKMSWTDSFFYCKRNGSDLAAVRSPIDQWLIEIAYDVNGINGPYWIGRNDQGLNGQHCEGIFLGSNTYEYLYEKIDMDCNFKYIPICEVD